jgi:hypothetical protein
MSRYMILVILNFPLIMAGFLSALVGYKMGLVGKRRFILRAILWLGILFGLVFAEPIYRFLFSNNLTATEPLSLFDVVQITGIVFTLFIASQAYARVDLLERRMQELHRELSIKFSEKDHKTKNRT